MLEKTFPAPEKSMSSPKIESQSHISFQTQTVEWA